VWDHAHAGHGRGRAEGTRDVIFIHYARSRDVHAFGQAIADWQRVHPQLTAQVFEQGAAAGSPAGRLTLDQLRGWVPADAEVYVLGPKPFMGFVDRNGRDRRARATPPSRIFQDRQKRSPKRFHQ
jgi:ferredoxin-NADP reductase